MGGDAGFVVGSRCLRDQIFCGRTRDRPFCAIHSAVASAHRRRHGSTGCGPVAILPALANPRAECPSLAMAMVSLEGLATHLGFGILAWLWFMTALQAYRAIGRGEIEAHQRWMMRNFALSLAAVTLRNELPLMLFAPLVFPRFLHYPFVALLGAEPDRGRVDGATTPENHHEFGLSKSRKKPVNRWWLLSSPRLRSIFPLNRSAMVPPTSFALRFNTAIKCPACPGNRTPAIAGLGNKPLLAVESSPSSRHFESLSSRQIPDFVRCAGYRTRLNIQFRARSGAQTKDPESAR